MPLIHPQVAPGSQGYRVRHVGPKTAVWPNPPAAISTFPLLNQPAMISRPLPVADQDSDPDYQQGQWMGRVNDHGDAQLVFPNAISSNGMPWRDRFDSQGHNQFLEIYNDGYLEFVCVILNPTKAQDAVTVAGSDAFMLQKKAYERDLIVVSAPRDLIERATQQWTVMSSDSFLPGPLDPQWTNVSTGGGTAQPGGEPGVGSGLFLGLTGTNQSGGIQSLPVINGLATGAWRAWAFCDELPTVTNSVLTFQVAESGGERSQLTWTPNVGGKPSVTFTTGGGQVNDNLQTAAVPVGPSGAFYLESDGEWVWAFFNGQFIGGKRRSTANIDYVQTMITLANPGNATDSAQFGGVLTEALYPFLMRGSDKGDYVLPGDSSSYPSGGLHGRYYNDLDLAADGDRLLKILHPARSQAYSSGSGPGEYQNKQDATINGIANPLPGAATVNWSVKEFGSIYLPLSKGNFQFSITCPIRTAVRVWVGQTQFGQQLVDKWTWSAGASTFNFTVSASTLAGSLPYPLDLARAGLPSKVSRDGWYPIRIEYAVDSTAGVGPVLKLTNSPATYVDPGGKTINSGAQSTVVPATSLSPLGMIDQRYQGISYYDMAQQTANAVVYQFSVEPYRLETLGQVNPVGCFPGQLAPRLAEGHPTDVILTPDTDDRQEGLLNYSAQEDASDFIGMIFGNGAGFQNGNTGQLQGMVFDSSTLRNSLFDVQGWQDFSDASFLSLLDALLNSQLGLRLSPWQLVSADPRAQKRLSFLWPLPSGVQEMRWRPGDSVRLRLRDISVWDRSPRQLLTVQRAFTPEGVTGTSVGWANRPRGPLLAQRQHYFTTTRLARSRQRTQSTLSGNLVSSTFTGAGPASTVAFLANEQVVRAYLQISKTPGIATLTVLINGTDVTTQMHGPWLTAPFSLDLTAAATSDTNGDINVVVNNSGASGAFIYQLFVDVLR